MVEIIVAIIGAVATIGAVVVTAKSTTSKMQQSLQTTQAVTDQKIEDLQSDMTDLKAEVREHNNYGKQIPVLDERIKVINHRLDDIEKKVM